MSDLIRRKATERAISELFIDRYVNFFVRNESISFREISDRIISAVKKQPTAYDVDKAVERLEEMAIGIPTIRGVNMVISLNTTIEIVRSGMVK